MLQWNGAVAFATVARVTLDRTQIRSLSFLNLRHHSLNKNLPRTDFISFYSPD